MSIYIYEYTCAHSHVNSSKGPPAPSAELSKKACKAGAVKRPSATRDLLVGGATVDARNLYDLMYIYICICILIYIVCILQYY